MRCLKASVLGIALVVFAGCGDRESADPVGAAVGRLDFDGYKAAIRGLSQFGDRKFRTDSNARALEWLEAELLSYGYINVEHITRPGSPHEALGIYATKVGTEHPDEMYIVSAHMDGMGGGEAANDDASGCAVVLELARVMGAREVSTGRSVRFIFWNGEELGTFGSQEYVAARAERQGIEDPVGSGRYPEPKWLGIIQHDMMLFDHGLPPAENQSSDADIDIEYKGSSKMGLAAASLATELLQANRAYATDYPANIGLQMSNTDSVPFQDHTAAVSIRENQRLAEIGAGSNPHWHRETDRYETFSEADFRLGFNAAQTTLGAIGRLAGIHLR